MPSPSPRRILLLVAAAELLAMSLWFSGTVVLPHLARRWGVEVSAAAWLTMAVQLGFVVGGLLAALFNLPDTFSASRLFVVSCVGGAAVNAAFALVAEEHRSAAIALRFLTGAFLAGVYPTGMKILTGWYRDGRGLALGILVGALTVGSALPHAVGATGNLPWRVVVLTCSALALLGAVLVAWGVRDGPYAAPSPPVDLSQIVAVFRDRSLRLANFGYFGHMWELYSMWGWIAVMLAAAAGGQGRAVGLASFLAIAAGGLGCVWAGRASDRPVGGNSASDARTARRARVTIVAMAVSGGCCLLAALVFDYFALLVIVCLIWGVAVVADSAQFSTIISEVADRRYVGTALALQTALGFLLTVASIRVIAVIGDEYGWRWAAASMAVGPALGILAMRRLERNPEKLGMK